MDLRRHRYFLVIAEEENLHRASERLNIAQPALSRQIRLLENDLGVSLFKRLPRGLQLTAAGKSYLEDVTELIRIADRSRQRARLLDQGGLGRLRIGFHDTAHQYPIFRKIFSDFLKQYPKVDFQFRLLSSEQQTQLILSESIDFGFCFSWEPHHAQIDHIPLVDDNFSIAMSAESPIAKKNGAITVADLGEHPFVWADRTVFRSHSDALLRACGKLNFTPNIAHDGLSSMSAMLSLVASNVGFAFVPNVWVNIVRPFIVTHPVEGLSLPVSLNLIWHRNNRSASIDNFKNVVRESLSSGKAQDKHPRKQT